MELNKNNKIILGTFLIVLAGILLTPYIKKSIINQAYKIVEKDQIQRYEYVKWSRQDSPYVNNQSLQNNVKYINLGDFEISSDENEVIYYSYESKEIKRLDIKSNRSTTLTALTNPEVNGVGKSRVKKFGDWIVWVEEEVMKVQSPKSSYWELNAYNMETKELIGIDRQNEEDKNRLNAFDTYNNKIVYSIDGVNIKSTSNISKATVNIYDLESNQNNTLNYDDFGINCSKICAISIYENKFVYSGTGTKSGGGVESSIVGLYDIETNESKLITKEMSKPIFLSEIVLKDNELYGIKYSDKYDSGGKNPLVDFIKLDIESKVEEVLIENTNTIGGLRENAIKANENRNNIYLNLNEQLNYDVNSGEFEN